MAETTPQTSVVKQFLRPEDIAWLLLFAILGFCQEDRNYSADLVLVCLAIVQVIEPKVPVLSSSRGHLSVLLLKMLLCYLLVGYSHGINSSFYVIFLLPIISAATTLDLLGTVAFIALACVAYASFLFFVNWEQEYIALPQWRLLGLRISFFPVVGLLVYQQARGKRDEMERTRAAAEQLAASNRSLRETQATLRRSERLAALGQLTAGLAHELRNPLGTIKASAELLNKPSTLQKPEIAEELAGYITTEVDRTNSLVSRFLDFARPLALHPQRADLRETVAQTVAQVQNRADAHQVKVETDLPSVPVEFSFDAALLSVVLLNLLQNAIDASTEGSSVVISVRNEAESVHITVSDHGAGIAEENLESIFNPFFTTKENGTGLGLALVAKIVDEHQGKITVRSRAGEGSVFEIVLPCPEQI